MDKKLKILWFSWKDIHHPQAGGAEEVTDQLLTRLAADGHQVKLITSRYFGSRSLSNRKGYQIHRAGNRYAVYLLSVWQYFTRFYRWPDLVIDEINTIPFFTSYYASGQNIILIHQLTRQIWFHQMFFPLSLIGYLLEPIFLQLLCFNPVVTVSQSTRQDLSRFGFNPRKIKIISEGSKLKPVSSLSPVKKITAPTILAFGSVRAMKRTDHVLQAFEKAKQEIPELQLIIAGDIAGRYGQKITKLARNSRYHDSIKILGRIADAAQKKLMQQSHLLCVTSLKEGWGLVVTEAASQGTPAVVYDVDGLRDSVRHRRTGLVCRQNNPEQLASNIIALLNDRKLYKKLQQEGWRWSHDIDFDRSYQDFTKALKQFGIKPRPDRLRSKSVKQRVQPHNI